MSWCGGDGSGAWRRMNGWTWLKDFLWPPQSLVGEAGVTTPGSLDPASWSALRFLTPPWCACCGFTFATDDAPGGFCGACLADPPDFDIARAPLAYDAISRQMILDLKRAGRRDGLATFGAWMVQAGGTEWPPDALIAPTPLHWTRLIERRFNQSAWLAEALASRTKLPLKRELLERVRRRRSQGGLSASARRRNVAGVFRLPKRHHALVRGRTVVLVDDVFTTGATANACARALKAGGAARVCVITLARVMRPANLATA